MALAWCLVMGRNRKRVFVVGLCGALVLWLLFCAIVAGSIDPAPPRVYLLFGSPGLGWGLVLLFFVLWLRNVRSWPLRLLLSVPFLSLVLLVVRIVWFSRSSLLSPCDFLILDLLLYIGPAVGGALGVAIGIVALWGVLRRRQGRGTGPRAVLTERTRRLLAFGSALALTGGVIASCSYTAHVGPEIRQHPPKYDPARYQALNAAYVAEILDRCWAYKSDKGQWPVSLEELVRTGYLDAKFLRNWRRPGRRPGCLYFRPTREIAGPEDVVICEAYSDWPEGGVVVGLDWNRVIVVKREDELQRMLGGKTQGEGR